ncbi:caspase family protein [bacterium]|nr:caspase family protein [bacterium]
MPMRLWFFLLCAILMPFRSGAFAEIIFSKSALIPVSLVHQKPVLGVTVSFSDPDRYMDAGQEAQVVVEITNMGRGKAYDVKGYISGGPLNGIVLEQSSVAGTIPPGGKKLLTFSSSAPDSITDRIIPLRLAITEKYGYSPAVVDIALSCRAKNNSRNSTPTTIRTTMNRISIDDAVPSTGCVNPDGVAVVIGNCDYDPASFGSNAYAINDARTVREYLVRVFGYDPDRILFYQNATADDFREVFGTVKSAGIMTQYIKPDTSDVFIYYCGFGAVDQKTGIPCLIPVDSAYAPENLQESGCSLELLLNNLAVLKPRSVTLVIDTAFSDTGNQGTAGTDIDGYADRFGNMALFMAASPGERSGRYHESMHGLFTYVFLDSARNLAMEGKTAIFAGDLFKNVADEKIGVPGLSQVIFNAHVQHPRFTGNAELILAGAK